MTGGIEMFGAFEDKKKRMLSWILFAASVILMIIQIVISISPANDSDSLLYVVAGIQIIMGIINLVLIVFGIVLFNKSFHAGEGKSTKVIGIVLRVLVLIPVALMTVLWMIGIITYGK